MDTAKQEIINRFRKNVKGETPDVSFSIAEHDGKYGHWLEDRMGIAHNGDNRPDLFGYEMKNDTRNKTTFGDWSPDVRVYGRGERFTRDEFAKIFGHKTSDSRWSWSGTPVPKGIDTWNSFGEKLVVSDNKDLQIFYNYDKDMRNNKAELVPEDFRTGEHLLMQWSFENISEKVENKFGNKGWFKCLLGKDGRYGKIVFGAPFNYDEWLADVKTGKIYLDAGLFCDESNENNRPYMSWRASNSYWMSKVIEEYM